MTRLLGFLGVLLIVGSLLLLAQCSRDQVRGETAVRPERGSPPKTVTRATGAAEFKGTMAWHWLGAVLPALAGWSLLSSARRQESRDMLSPDFKGLGLVEEVGATNPSAAAAESPATPVSASALLNFPGRILSVLVCLAYLVGMFVTGPVLLGDRAVLYAVLAGCLVLIWLPDEIDDLLGNIVTLFNRSYEGVVYRPTLRILIVGAGWFFLVGLPLLLGFLNR
jgi:hypothetical protein